MPKCRRYVCGVCRFVPWVDRQHVCKFKIISEGRGRGDEHGDGDIGYGFGDGVHGNHDDVCLM